MLYHNWYVISTRFILIFKNNGVQKKKCLTIHFLILCYILYGHIIITDCFKRKYRKGSTEVLNRIIN